MESSARTLDGTLEMVVIECGWNHHKSMEEVHGTKGFKGFHAGFQVLALLMPFMVVDDYVWNGNVSQRSVELLPATV